MSYHDHQKSPDDVDVHILDVAQQLINRTGSQDFTMDQLAEASQLSRATIYRRVGSKETLLRRLAGERGLDIEASLGQDMADRILQAARVAFGKNGLTRTTMEQIAQEAGLGVATLYRHFGDRDHLVRAFLHQHAPQRAFQEVTADGGSDIRADLLHLVTEMLTFLHQNQDMIWLGLMEGKATEQLLGRLMQAPQGARTDIARFLETAIAVGHLKDRDPQQMTTALAGMLVAFGLEMPVFGGPPLEDPRPAAEFIVDLFLNGLRKQP